MRRLSQEALVTARLLGQIGVGPISFTDDTGPSQLLQVNLQGKPMTDMAALYHYGFTARPHPGADAAVLFVGGDRSKPVIIATGDRRYRLTGMAAGEVAIHDDIGQVVHLTRTGIVISAPQGLTVDGPLIVTGDAMIGGIGFLEHDHGGIEPGTARTGPPVAITT